MNSEVALDLFRLIVLVFIFAGCIRLIYVRKETTFVVFFTLGIACILFSDFYWLIYDILRPNNRMPFAANEICEWSLFLLLGSAISSKYPREYWRFKKESYATAIFVIGNVALWIGWSGEWIQDIFTGIALFSFLFPLVRQIKYERIFDGIVGSLFTIVAFLLLLGQAGTFFVEEPLKGILDISCYILMFATLIVLIFKAILSFKKNSHDCSICLSFSGFAWCAITLYMSSEAFYLAAMGLSAVCFLLMYAALRREVIDK